MQRYFRDMTSQLEAIAKAANLDLVAYFLGMARCETELFVRRAAEAEARATDAAPADEGTQMSPSMNSPCLSG